MFGDPFGIDLLSDPAEGPSLLTADESGNAAASTPTDAQSTATDANTEPFAVPDGMPITTPDRSVHTTSVPPSPSLPTVLETGGDVAGVGAAAGSIDPSPSVEDAYMYRYKPGAASSSDSETVTTYELRGDQSSVAGANVAWGEGGFDG